MPAPSSPSPASQHPLRHVPHRRARLVALASGAATALLAAAACTPLTGSGGPSPTVTSAATVEQPAPTESLLTESPDTHSSVGSLAQGFPVDLVPVPDGAEVMVSSAAPAAGTTGLWDISLNLRTAQDTAGLVDVYRQHLVAAGFVETAPEHAEPGLAAQATFSRSDGAEILVLGVLDRDGVRTMTLGGRVSTGS